LAEGPENHEGKVLCSNSYGENFHRMRRIRRKKGDWKKKNRKSSSKKFPFSTIGLARGIEEMIKMSRKTAGKEDKGEPQSDTGQGSSVQGFLLILVELELVKEGRRG